MVFIFLAYFTLYNGGEGEGGMFKENSIETCILSSVKQITSPGWMHETSTRTWCIGKTWGDRVEREVGVGIGMGNTCKPMAVSFQCMTKSTTIKKIIIKKKKRQVEFPGSGKMGPKIKNKGEVGEFEELKGIKTHWSSGWRERV